jgi:antitoxin component of MazEF toxin-antitoxin module
VPAQGPSQKQSLKATVRVSGGAAYLRLEEGAGTELGGSSVRVACRGRHFAAATMRLPGELAVHGLALPKAVAEECGLGVGDAVTVEVQGGGAGNGRVPADAAAALAAAGTDLAELAPKERRLAVTLVREAGSPQTRRERIEALVEACLEASKRN